MDILLEYVRVCCSDVMSVLRERQYKTLVVFALSPSFYDTLDPRDDQNYLHLLLCVPPLPST
jgi:hypothetical protein